MCLLLILHCRRVFLGLLVAIVFLSTRLEALGTHLWGPSSGSSWGPPAQAAQHPIPKIGVQSENPSPPSLAQLPEQKSGRKTQPNSTFSQPSPAQSPTAQPAQPSSQKKTQPQIPAQPSLPAHQQNTKFKKETCQNLRSKPFGRNFRSELSVETFFGTQTLNSFYKPLTLNPGPAGEAEEAGLRAGQGGREFALTGSYSRLP